LSDLRNGLKDKKIIVWDHNRGFMFQRASVILDDPAAELDGELRDRLRAPFRQPVPSVPSLFNPNRRSCAPPTPQKLPISHGIWRTAT